MKSIFFVVLLSTLPVFSQENIEHKIDSLRFVSEMPYICRGDIYTKGLGSIGCGDVLFWNVVKLKSEAIDYLLNKLSDTTVTNANVPNLPYNYRVGDVAFVALKELIHEIPTYELLGIKFDSEGCGSCAYWSYLNESKLNRDKFEITVKRWYEINKTNLIWIKSNDFSSCECSSLHPNGGHFKLK